MPRKDKKKPQIAWIIKNKHGWKIPRTMKDYRSYSILIMEENNRPLSWGEIYRKGFRCVKIELREVK